MKTFLYFAGSGGTRTRGVRPRVPDELGTDPIAAAALRYVAPGKSMPPLSEFDRRLLEET